MPPPLEMSRSSRKVILAPDYVKVTQNDIFYIRIMRVAPELLMVLGSRKPYPPRAYKFPGQQINMVFIEKHENAKRPKI